MGQIQLILDYLFLFACLKNRFKLSSQVLKSNPHLINSLLRFLVLHLILHFISDIWCSFTSSINLSNLCLRKIKISCNCYYYNLLFSFCIIYVNHKVFNEFIHMFSKNGSPPNKLKLTCSLSFKEFIPI